MNYKQFIISGKVQGTGFREFVRKKGVDLFGYVRNVKNGDVEVIVKGDQKKVEELLKSCRKGPFLASVKDVKVSEIEIDEEYDSFFVKFS